MIKLETWLLCCAVIGVGYSEAPAELAAPPLTSPAARAASLPFYESAFESYRPYRESPVGRWRERNDEAGRVGGHGGVLKAGATPAATESKPRIPSPVGTPEHGRHGAH